MHPATRKQTDNHDKASRDSGISFVGTEDRTRQEFRDEADLNILLKRFGVGNNQRPLTFGEVDYTIDFQQALSAINDARDAWRKLPPAVRDRYPTWRDLLNATESGSLDLEPPPPPVKPAVSAEGKAP